MIRQPNYEVGPEFVERFSADSAATSASSRRREAPATPCSISPATSRRGLRAPASRSIEDLGLCTYADAATFYSYRRSVHRNEPDYGRHINAIALSD